MRGRGAPGSPIGGAIQSLALSTVRRGVIWVGTNNGLIKLTKDEGKTWDDVSIPDLPVSGRGDILAVHASHFRPAPPFPPGGLSPPRGLQPDLLPDPRHRK